MLIFIILARENGCSQLLEFKHQIKSCIHAHAHACAHTHTCACTHTHIHTCIHTHTRTYTHTHTHTHTQTTHLPDKLLHFSQLHLLHSQTLNMGVGVAANTLRLSGDQETRETPPPPIL